MPIAKLSPPKYVPPKPKIVDWSTWRKGLNLLLRENEIDGAEMTTSTNLLLVGSGIPTKRWGSANYFLAGATGTSRFVLPIKDTDDSIQVLSLTDWGLLTKKNGASYTILTGASWPSGYNIEGVQLGGNVYLFSESREMVRYDFSTLTGFPTIAAPTGALASNLSGATGTTQWSWRITAIGRSGGETLGSTAISLASLPEDLKRTLILVKWTTTSAASGDLLGYNVYRGSPGNETWVGGTGPDASSWLDFGLPPSDPFRTVPLAEMTGGLKGKYVIRFQDRLIVAGVPGYPTRVFISGRWPYQERFDWYAGGGYIEIEPDSGQNVTGLGIHQEKLVITKENSIWQLLLNTVQYGVYVILDPQYKLLTASQGCSSHRSIVPVENDLMFANRKGIYILRYEPQLLTVLNANEISAKVRPFFEGLTDADLTSCAALYVDKKYILSFPSSKKTIVFDRERLSFMGPWLTPYGITHWAKYIDSTGTEKWIAADKDDNYISEFSKTLIDDKGTVINTVFKSKKEDMGDWTILKTLNEIYLNFRGIVGSISINIYIEQRDGKVVVARSFAIPGSGAQGTSGFGTDQFGLSKFGMSNNTATTQTGETPKKRFIYKTARTYQVEVRTTSNTDNYELLGVLASGISQDRGNTPSHWLT